MARKFKQSIDLQKNQLLQAALENRTSAPSNAILGQVYFNTTLGIACICIGVSPQQWTPMSAPSVSDPMWTPISRSYVSVSSFSFNGSATDALMVNRSLFMCNGKFGFIDSVTVEDGYVVLCHVISVSPLNEDDTGFSIAYTTKIDFFKNTISLPGVLEGDSKGQGGWVAAIPCPSVILSVDASLLVPSIFPPEEAVVTFNLTINDSEEGIFAEDPDFVAGNLLQNLIPTTKILASGDYIRMIVRLNKNYAESLQVGIYIVPLDIFRYEDT